MGKMPGWMTAWALVAVGAGWADAQTGLIPVPPGNVKVTVEFRQAGQSL